MNRAPAFKGSLLALALLVVLTGAAPASRIEISILGLRNGKGVVSLCLTRNEARFPDCASDPGAVTRSIPAKDAARVSLSGLSQGTYALAVFHDENGNGKLDTFLAIPREGFGFSRNPTIRFGAPRFEQVAFTLSGTASMTVRVNYFL